MKFNEFGSSKGLTLVPLKGKVPVLKGWQNVTSNSSQDISEWISKGYDVGISCGAVSGDLEVIDVDSKYQLDGDNIMKRWGEEVGKVDKALCRKILITRTDSGGYHVIYRCPSIAIPGNQKLALRPTIDGESGKAMCLIETRGTGGQIHAYKAIQGSYENIPTVTEEERDILITSARILNEVVVKSRKEAKREVSSDMGLSPLDHYNAETDVSVCLDLLLTHGWSIHSDRGNYYELTRPGKASGVSATLDYYDGMFFPWSSEGFFEDEQAYSFAGVYTMLEHGGDFSEATKQLAKEGWGERLEKKERDELVDAMLGKEKEILTSEEEKAVLSQFKSSEQEMDAYLTYLKTAREFRLSPRYSELQKLMKDIQPGYYVGWAAASGCGKTSTSRQIFNDYLNVTDQDGIFFTMELKSRELALRNAQELRSPDVGHYVDKDITNEHLVTNTEFRNEVTKSWSNFYSVETAYDVNVMFEMAKVFKKHIEQKGRRLGAIVIDFVQMAKGGHNIDKQPEIAAFLKFIAKTLDVIVVGILQLNSTIDKFEEPNENHISGHKALFQTSDFGFLLWKNVDDKRRIIVASKKERHSLESKCDLVQTGMRIHSEEHQPIEEGAIARMAGNRGLRR